MPKAPMTCPNWGLIDTVKVDAKPDGFWNRAVEFIPGPRLLRFRVVDKDKDGKSVPLKWTANDAGDSRVEYGPNGAPSGDAKTSYLCPGAPLGALIGKLGGSSVDIPDASQPLTPFGTKRVFAIGAYCIMTVAAGDSGPLYLTMNDVLQSFANHSGALHVEICDAPA